MLCFKNENVCLKDWWLVKVKRYFQRTRVAIAVFTFQWLSVYVFDWTILKYPSDWWQFKTKAAATPALNAGPSGERVERPSGWV
ncbi:unnamed protein product [Camellia sinensis]